MSEEENVEKIPSNEKPKSYVVEGATLKCSCGDKECKLKTPGRKSVLIQGKLQANIMDFIPKVNIDSFGKCKSLKNPLVAAATSANHGRLKPMPCIPNVTIPWINGKEDMLADEAPALLDCSKNMCIWGGKISIVKDGQSEAPSRVEQGVEKMGSGGILMMIGAAALITAITILTAPVSVPTLLVAAGVGATTAAVAGGAVTVAAVGVAAAGAATTVIGGSEVAEGGQDVVFGALGSDTSSVNVVRDFGFGGDEAAYNQAKGIVTTTAAVGTMVLAPVAQTVSAASAGARPEKADSTKQTKTTGNTGGKATSGKTVNPGTTGKSTTSALKLKSGKTDAVGQTKTAGNAATRQVPSTSINRGRNSVKPTEPYNRRKHYGNTPTKADRKAIGGESVDHDPPLVKRYYEGDPKKGEKPGYLQTPIERRESATDRSRMRPSTKVEQNKQGAEMSKYSKEKKKEYEFE